MKNEFNRILLSPRRTRRMVVDATHQALIAGIVGAVGGAAAGSVDNLPGLEVCGTYRPTPVYTPLSGAPLRASVYFTVFV